MMGEGEERAQEDFPQTLVGHVRRASATFLSAINSAAYGTSRPAADHDAQGREDRRMSFYSLFPVYKSKAGGRQQNSTALASTSEPAERRPRKPRQDKPAQERPAQERPAQERPANAILSQARSQMRRFSTLASRSRLAETVETKGLAKPVEKESHDHGDHGARSHPHARQKDMNHAKNHMAIRHGPTGTHHDGTTLTASINPDKPTPRVV